MKKGIFLLIALSIILLAQGKNKSYITHIYDFQPAPGQFVNLLPKHVAGETKADILAKVAEAICGQEIIDEIEAPDGTVVTDTTIKVTPGMISLGSFGGYVVFGFDHPVVNVQGEYDLQIFGNAFQSDSLSNVSGGSSEPGIVMVSRDVNHNGIPDDPWYELAGSEYNNPRTQHNYTVTYYPPTGGKPVTDPNDYSIDNLNYIAWTSNDTNPDSVSGYVAHNRFRTQSYWPGWLPDSTSLTYSGTKIPGNAVNLDNYWFQYFYGWGYVDNRPDYKYDGSTPHSNENKGFKIDWAVDENGNHKDLSTIDFVKVQNAMFQYCGPIGETSTEVCGAIDLHPDAVVIKKGDVNGDGDVNVADVTTLIAYILGNDVPVFITANAYMDDDDIINVNDVTALINYILQ